MEMLKNRKSTMINAQSNARHPLFEIQNKLGTMMPWMTSVANTGGQTKAPYHGIQENLEVRARML